MANMLNSPRFEALARLLRVKARALIWTLALAVTMGSGWVSFQTAAQVGSMQAQTWASMMGATAKRGLLHPEELQLALARAHSATSSPALISLHNRAGLIVATNTAQPAWPTTTHTAVAMADGVSVGEANVSHSLLPVLATMLMAAVVACLFAALALALLRGSVKSGEASAPDRAEPNPRQETEDRLRIVFENSIDGIMTFTLDGSVLSCNPAAGQLLTRDPSAVVGMRLSNLIEPVPEAPDGAPFPTGLHESVARLADGATFPVEVTVSESNFKGAAQMIVFVRDITERRAAHDRMAMLANFDSLTGLPNRVLFRDRLREGMKRAKRSGRVLGLMFLDLDRFKVVNDSLGHEVGDRLLQHVAQTLTDCLRNVDTVGLQPQEPITVSRLGGDEFTVIVEDIGGADDAALIARRILDALLEPFVSGSDEIVISTSIGISLYPHDDTDLDGLVRHTDMAMYRSKALGRNTFSFYNANMNAALELRLSLETSLRHALERNEFSLQYQPKADLRTGRITGVEALIRWNRPGEGVVPPDRFITVLEETGLILPVGAWVIRTACAELARWDKLGLAPLSLAVNLSARQFRQQYLFQLISETLAETRIAPHRLELELTESQLMEDNDASRAMLASIAEMGVRVAIDDFGTGHSSLSYLKRFSIDTLKIDRSFVREITNNDEDSAIATAVIALGRSLQLKVVAEGVETLHQADYLRALGCDEIQGYLLSRPLSSERLVAWLGTYRGAKVLGVGGDLQHDERPVSELMRLDLPDEAFAD